MMLNPRLTNCVECATIPNLIEDIDCRLTELAKDLYNNTIFILNRSINSDAILNLLNYKRILTYKTCNAEWANCYTIEQIASRVKLLIHQ